MATDASGTADFPILIARVRVPGSAIPQGSKSTYINPHPFKPSKRGGGRLCGGGFVSVVDANPKLDGWREHVRLTSLSQRPPKFVLIDGACAVRITFYVSRPPSLPRSIRFPERSYDLDKLERAILDGITGTLLANDARVCDLLGFKRFAMGHEPCVVVSVYGG